MRSCVEWRSCCVYKKFLILVNFVVDWSWGGCRECGLVYREIPENKELNLTVWDIKIMNSCTLDAYSYTFKSNKTDMLILHIREAAIWLYLIKVLQVSAITSNKILLSCNTKPLWAEKFNYITIIVPKSYCVTRYVANTSQVCMQSVT